MRNKCLHCDRLPRTRGCCPPCYDRLHLMVQKGLTTFAELERQGKVLPTKNNKVMMVRRFFQGAKS